MIYLPVYFWLQIDQLQLGLPSRDYFLDAESDRDLNAYHTYMTEVSHLLGKAVINKVNLFIVHTFKFTKYPQGGAWFE